MSSPRIGHDSMVLKSFQLSGESHGTKNLLLKREIVVLVTKRLSSMEFE